MKKLFISQPMNGRSDEEILEARAKAYERVEKEFGEPLELIDSFFKDNAPDGVNPGLWFLGKSLMLLASADIAYFDKGWEDARGCSIEYDCADEYGIGTITEDSGEEFLMTFGGAIECLKQGLRVSREGWNGKGLYVVYQKGYPEGIPCNKQTAEAWGIKEGSLFRCDPYLQINTVEGSHAMWAPSIRDCLAEDWYIIHDSEGEE